MLKNKPKTNQDSVDGFSKQRANMVVPQLLMTFAQKVISQKLDGILYWAEQNEVTLPEHFKPDLGQDTPLATHFLEQMKETDKMFLNKLCFYLAKEKVDYKGIDSFLNLYILRKWPELKQLLAPGEEPTTNHFKVRRTSGSHFRTQPVEKTVGGPSSVAIIFKQAGKLERSASKDLLSVTPMVKLTPLAKPHLVSDDKAPAEDSKTWAEPTNPSYQLSPIILKDWPSIKSLKRYQLKINTDHVNPIWMQTSSASSSKLVIPLRKSSQPLTNLAKSVKSHRELNIEATTFQSPDMSRRIDTTLHQSIGEANNRESFYQTSKVFNPQSSWTKKDSLYKNVIRLQSQPEKLLNQSKFSRAELGQSGLGGNLSKTFAQDLSQPGQIPGSSRLQGGENLNTSLERSRIANNMNMSRNSFGNLPNKSFGSQSMLKSQSKAALGVDEKIKMLQQWEGVRRQKFTLPNIMFAAPANL